MIDGLIELRRLVRYIKRHNINELRSDPHRVWIEDIDGLRSWRARFELGSAYAPYIAWGVSAEFLDDVLITINHEIRRQRAKLRRGKP